MENILKESLQGSIIAQQKFAEEYGQTVCLVARRLASAFQQEGKLLIFGNGGSAADAQHMAGEFVNRFLLDRPPLPAIALTTDSSILTSVANDYSFDDIFSKQIAALGKEGDVALGITTSGNSPNVVQGMQAAAERGLVTIALTGGDGGAVKECADFVLIAPTNHTPHIQEVHLWVEHLLCQLVDELLYGSLVKEGPV